MKERAVLFRNRPLAISPAVDNNLEHLGNLLDEDLALRLGFNVVNLQYVRVSLASSDTNKKTRITGTVRATIQILSKGKPGRSLALNARVVRDLFRLTGADAFADKTLFEKLEKKESDRDTSDNPITGAGISSTAAHNIKLPVSNMEETSPNILKELPTIRNEFNIDESSIDEDSACSSEKNCSECKDFTDSSCDSTTTNTRPRKYWIRCALHGEAHAKASVRKDLHQASHHHDEDSFSDSDTNSDSGSSRDCSSCAVYSSCSSEEEGQPHNHRMRCALHAEAHLKAYTRKVNICRVRGRNNKLLRDAASKITEEEVDAERIRRAKSKKTPDEVLDECFPGGAKFAHQLSDRWAKEKAKKDKLDENKKTIEIKIWTY